MKKLMVPALLICFGLIGCGVKGTDSSKATPPMEPEKHTQEIDDMVKSGKIQNYGEVK